MKSVLHQSTFIQILQVFLLSVATVAAAAPADAGREARPVAEEHWSFKPLGRQDGPRTLDAFIDAKLAEKGLRRSPEADPATWLRRVTLDLTGLLPTPEAVAEFQLNPNLAATVDRLLSSPRYGERWAQHWLDVIRWAETVGFETNKERQNAWPYRDWVIASLNADKPYNQFLFEQIAGDTVGEDAALGFLVAGPANLAGQVGRDEAAMRGARQDELDEVIRTVGQAFFGLTIGCARCHDHKFDPILERDYYSLQAVFAGLGYGTRRWRGAENDIWTSRLPAARKRVLTLRARLETQRQAHGLRPPLDTVHTEDFEPVSASAIRMRIQATAKGGPASLYEFEVHSVDGDNVALASAGATPSASSFALANQSRHFDNLIDGSIDKRQSYPWVAVANGPAWIQINFKEAKRIDQVVLHRGSSMPVDFVIEIQAPGSAAWREIVHTRDRLPRNDDIRKPATVELAGVSSDDTAVLLKLIASFRGAQAQLTRFSNGPQVYAAGFDPDPAVTHQLRRGDAMQPVAEVAPGIPEFLGRFDLPPGAPEPERRIALARHLMRADHPLTARVLVNRVWHHHFGTGLVDTPSDFGKMGTKPSHPELLDWLAARFVEDGWSLKNLHRLILNSETYRQASAPRPNALAIDADSRLLWRYPPRRMEAEALRDSILSVSGKLNLKMGGRGFDFFNLRGGLSDYLPKETFEKDGWRRMVYAHKVRMISVDIFGSFDCPDAGQMKPSRTRSITPVQSLGLLNSPFANRQAAFFADRLRAEAGSKPAAQIDRGFALAYSRDPSPAERSHLVALAGEHGLESVCRALFNTSEFAFIQ